MCVFISFARGDAEFAEQLENGFAAQQYLSSAL